MAPKSQTLIDNRIIHLESFIKPGIEIDITNGICICADIHKEFHKLYGTSTTTVNFEQFLQEKYSWNTPFPWRQGNHEPSFSIDIIQQNQLNQKNEKTSHFIDLVKTHGHLLISGELQNVKSNVVIYCNEHQSEYTTTFGNYRRCKTGLPCCGRAQQVQKAKHYKRNALRIFVKDNDNDNEDK